LKEVWIYIDESQGPSAEASQRGKPFRIGVLAVSAPISVDIPREALERLSAPEDARTLKRGHFHASQDSPNAHSAFCAAINKASLAGEFHDSQWHFDQKGGREYDESRLHRHSITLGLIRYAQSGFDRLNLEIAARTGSFTQHTLDHWLSEHITERLQAIPSQPILPCRFPEVKAEAVDSSVSGVQVCDFLLWAVQREDYQIDGTARGDDVWRKNVKFQRTFVVEDSGSPMAHQTFVLGAGLEQRVLPKMGGTPRRPEALGTDGIAEAIREVERLVRGAWEEANRGHPRIAHLLDRLAEAKHRLDTPNISDDDVRKIGKAFFLVCDTMPLYELTDAAAWCRISELRLVVGMTLDGTQITWSGMSTFWRKVHAGAS